MKRRSIGLFALALAASWSLAQANPPPTAPSGFLGDYSQLRPASDREGVMLFLDKTRSYRAYTKVMFEPIVIVLTPGSDDGAQKRGENARPGVDQDSRFG